MPASVRTVRGERLAECPFCVAHEYVCKFLADRQRDGRLVRGFIGPVALAPCVTLSYALRPDMTDPGRPNEEIALRWTPHTPLLPAFDGVIRMRIDGLRTLIRIEGSYRPPLGTAGERFDEVFGEHIVGSTIDDLLRRICRELEERERDWLVRNT